MPVTNKIHPSTAEMKKTSVNNKIAAEDKKYLHRSGPGPSSFPVSNASYSIASSLVPRSIKILSWQLIYSINNKKFHTFTKTSSFSFRYFVFQNLDAA